MRVQPFVEHTALVENPITESNVGRAFSSVSPLTKRAACGEDSQFGVVRFVIAIWIKSVHLMLQPPSYFYFCIFSRRRLVIAGSDFFEDTADIGKVEGALLRHLVRADAGAVVE